MDYDGPRGPDDAGRQLVVMISFLSSSPILSSQPAYKVDLGCMRVTNNVKCATVNYSIADNIRWLTVNPETSGTWQQVAGAGDAKAQKKN